MAGGVATSWLGADVCLCVNVCRQLAKLQAGCGQYGGVPAKLKSRGHEEP